MSGLSPTGFDRKRLIDIKTDLEDALKLAFGENIDLDPQSGFGQFIGIISEAISDQWESQENIYNSQYPSTATENQLSNVVMYNGIERQEATKSTVTATISGIPGTVIPAGSKASTTATESVFVTLALATISGGGTVSVSMESEEYGEIEASIGTLTVIDTPIYGWTSITNAAAATVGRAEETDAELRARRENSTQALGQNLIDALHAQLLDLDNVLDALVISNGTDSVVNGIPAHHFLSVVRSGADADIAETIWKNTPQGIDSFGTTTINHTDSQGFDQPINFTRPAAVPIYFRVYITINTSTFPGSGSDDIKDNMVEYGGDNFGIYDDVIKNAFLTPINLTPGITSIDIRLGLTPSPSLTANIPIAIDEYSSYDASQIEVIII